MSTKTDAQIEREAIAWAEGEGRAVVMAFLLDQPTNRYSSLRALDGPIRYKDNTDLRNLAVAVYKALAKTHFKDEVAEKKRRDAAVHATYILSKRVAMADHHPDEFHQFVSQNKETVEALKKYLS